MRIVILGVATLLSVACNNRENLQCQQSAACDLSGGGMCITATTGNRWCAYPDPACPGGYRYSTQDIGDGLSGQCAPGEGSGSDGGIDTRTLTLSVGGSGTGLITSTPTGVNCAGGTCTQTFAVGAQVSLSQSATTGVFLGWSNDCTGAAACTITMDRDHTVSALFGTPGEALWSTQLGGTQDDVANAVATDSDGNLLVIGTFHGSFTVGATTLTSAGGADIFVAKLLSATGEVVWIKSFGSTSDDTGLRIAVDTTNNIYITGGFQNSIDFGGGPLVSAGNIDGFAAKLDPTGGYVWAKQLGGQFADFAHGIDVRGNTVAVVGVYASSMTVNGVTLTNAGTQQGYLVEWTLDGGNGPVKTFTGGTSTSLPNRVVIDSSGNVVVAGSFNGTVDFGGGPVASNMVDAFLVKYSTAGAYLFGKYPGGSSNDSGGFVSIDASDNIFLVGTFSGSVSFGGASPLNTNTANMVAAKYSLAGSYQWAQAFGDTTAQVSSTDASANANGDLVVAGYFCGNLTFGSASLASVGACNTLDTDFFTARLSHTDGAPLTAARAGGASQDAAFGVAQTPDARHFVTGEFKGFAEFGGQARTSAGGFDAIVLALAPL